MKAKHTPGPVWIIKEAENYLHIAGKAGNIASLKTGNYNEICGLQANARRIVLTWNAHNELVAALKEAKEALEIAQGEWAGVQVPYAPEWASNLANIVEEINQAITKARGGA